MATRKQTVLDQENQKSELDVDIEKYEKVVAQLKTNVENLDLMRTQEAQKLLLNQGVLQYLLQKKKEQDTKKE